MKRHSIELCLLQEFSDARPAFDRRRHWLWKEYRDGFRLVYCGQVGIMLSPSAWWSVDWIDFEGDRNICVGIHTNAFVSSYQPFWDGT